MELFIFGLNEPEKICGSRDDPDDICKWEGVTCNAKAEVEKFEWTNKHEDGTGTLVLEFLPWSMKLFRVCSNALSGTIRLADLPMKIEELSLFSNQLTGSLDPDGLPATVRELGLRSNKFTGDISLETLPKCLEYLALADNQLSGAMCLTSLPPALEPIRLEKRTLKARWTSHDCQIPSAKYAFPKIAF
ncbi:leucine-rich repeat (LRR) protein [Perkinsela sp. CCAP 1560/4]|nr:leucine-rich repeat (LRR) protein [Perkinsela sp. CCAP 1560/4]|eukprot:KNH00532.1 leucine-rich repeat (LRR) protein [Perkinsela sp. CCAP 1560/4]